VPGTREVRPARLDGPHGRPGPGRRRRRNHRRRDRMTAQAPTPSNVADVEEALRDVVDPELGINVVDLGLVYGVTVDPQNHAVIDMTLTSAACPLTDVIEDQVSQALEDLVSDSRINWVWMPPWGPDKITEDGREQLRALGFNI